MVAHDRPSTSMEVAADGPAMRAGRRGPSVMAASCFKILA